MLDTELNMVDISMPKEPFACYKLYVIYNNSHSNEHSRISFCTLNLLMFNISHFHAYPFVRHA